MKKILVSLLLLSILVGCSSHASTQVSFADDVLVIVDGQKITKGDVYTMLKNQDISRQVVSLAQKSLVEANVELTDDIKNAAKKSLDDILKLYQGNRQAIFGDMSDEEILKTRLYPMERQSAFIKKYYYDNLDKILSEKQPIKLNVLTYANKEDADKALKLLKENKALTEVIKEYPTQPGQLALLSDNIVALNTLPQTINSYVTSDKVTLNSWSDIIEDSENKTFSLVNVLENDSKKLADEYASIYSNDMTTVNEIMNQLLKEADFKLYDQDIYNTIHNNQQLSHLLAE